MKLKLFTGEVIDLPNDYNYEQRVALVNQIMTQYGDVFHDKWESRSVKISLDVLSTYLVSYRTPEEKGKEDKEVLSRRKVREMKKGSKKQVNFSDLAIEDKQYFGLADSVAE